MCYARGLLCVSPFLCTSSSWVRSTGRISAIPYKHCQQASRQRLLPCSWHSRSAPGFSLLLLLQRHPQVWMAPSRRLHTSAQQRWGRHRGILFQPIPAGCFGTQGHVGPHGHPEIEYKAGIQHGALAIVLSSFINSALLLRGSICAVLCSFLMLPWASTAVFSTGLVLRSCS